MQTNELQALKASGILSSAAYIRMQLQATKPADSANFYAISIKQDFPGSTAAEVFNELANLTRDGKIEGSIPTSFTVTHSDPMLLTSYSPEQVRQLRGQSMFRQKGYLFFCLGADNPGKTLTQLVDPLRITQFYGLSMTDFFGELGRLTGDRTITTDIDRISIRWIAYTAPALQSDSSTVAIELERIKTSLERLLAEHIQAVDPHPNYATDADVLRLSSSLAEAIANFSRDLNTIAAEVNDKQPVGDYPLRSEIIASPKVTRSLYSANSPVNPSIGDVWEAYDSSGDTFDAERWTYNGTYWVSQRRIANWSFNALSAATNFFELLDKYPQKHGILFEWFTIGLKAGASNSSSAYATFTLSRRDSSGVSTALASFTTNTIAASGRLYSMKDIKQSFPYDQAIDAVIALVLTGSPGAMSGSASFSYRYAW